MKNTLFYSLDFSSTFMIDILYILFRPYGPIMLPIPLITIVLMLATKIRNYRDNFIVYPELPFVQPPKNLESSRLNLLVLTIIFVTITGHQFYSWRQVKFILIIIYVQGVLALCEFHYCEFRYCGFSKLYIKFS